MPIHVSCPNCGKDYQLKDAAAGKTFRCRECNAAITAPSAAAEDEFDFGDLGPEEAEAPPPARSRSVKKKGVGGKASKKSASSSSNSTLKWVLIAVGGGVLLLALCCGGIVWIGKNAVQKVAEGISGAAEVPAGMTFQQWREGFQTNLVERGPAPQEYELEPPPPDVEQVFYTSESLTLKAWVYRPPNVAGLRPALVFFHGGFAFGSGDLESCQPFMDEGFVVMAPMLRGENGNPGSFELFLGEIDDARAACQWLAKQPYVDAKRIYTFGHSVGGGVSAMLSLLDDVPIQHGGSSGGLYDHLTFLGWSDIAPFENTPAERTVRLLVGNTQHMRRRHYGYIGTEDDGFELSAQKLQSEAKAGGLLTVERIPGDHFTSFDASLLRYLQVVKSGG
jgi:acetyl esterase/lipase